MSAADFVELRRKLEKVTDKTVAVKNSITRLAFKKIGITDAKGLLKGPVFLAIGNKEPQLISKVLVEFAKGRENFQLDGAYLEGNVVPGEYVKSLAALPSREALIASVVGGLNAPISGFVNVMGQLIRSLAIALDQIHKTKASQAS